jgi:hypothetical protein
MSKLLARALNLWATEPSLVLTAVVAILTLLATFGVPISATKQNAIVGVVEALSVLVAGLVIRSQVTPLAAPSAPAAPPTATP